MSSPRLEHAKHSNPELAGLLDQVWDYVQKQAAAGQDFILPKLAGAALRLTDGEAYVLLELLVEAGILNRAFNVYCKPTGMLLATVRSEAELDEVPHCDFCDADHAPHEFRLEIAFQTDLQRGRFKKAA